MRYIGILALTLLSGCVTQAEREAQNAAKDDQQCQSYGAKPGTDPYIQCRVQMSNQRNNLRAAILASPGPSTCTMVGNTMNCN